MQALTREREKDLPVAEFPVSAGPGPFEAPGLSEEPAPAGSRRRLPPWLRLDTATWTWIGVGVIVAGFVLLAIVWGQVAGETQVYRQLPYLASGALVALGMVVVGLTVVVVARSQEDAATREAQLTRLVGVLHELRETFAEDGEGRP